MPGMMCDSTGRPRGRTGSPYVARLTDAGTQLLPCNRTRFGNETTGRSFTWLRNIGNRIQNSTTPIFTWVSNFFGNGTRAPQIRQRQQQQQQQQPQLQQQVAEGPRATDPGSSEFTASSTTSMAVGGILLVVVGAMFAAVLVVLNVRLAQVLRS